ncbi:MAG: HNH endonuclease signature motif containing protein [Planctomycetaceae bacterium]
MSPRKPSANWPPPEPPRPACSICLHDFERRELTKHHLIPKCCKGRETVLVCRNCHRQIHAIFTEKELEREFGTLESLLSAERLQGWIEWSRRRKTLGRLPVRPAKRR